MKPQRSKTIEKMARVCWVLSAIPVAAALPQVQWLPATPEDRAHIEAELAIDTLHLRFPTPLLQLDIQKLQVQPDTQDFRVQIWFEPVHLANSLCGMHSFHYATFLTPRQEPHQMVEYWSAESASDCSISSPSDAPQTVAVSDKIPTESIARIFAIKEQILQRALSEFGSTSRLELSPDQEWYLSNLKLSEFGINGVIYSALFTRQDADSGPIVHFSLDENGFVVYGLGDWIA